jgi:hypothetical protein
MSKTNPLQCTLDGTVIRMPHGAEEDSLKRRAEPSLQALADHLTALTDTHNLPPDGAGRSDEGRDRVGGA